MSVETLMEPKRLWVEGFKRGDVSAADAAFAPDCVVHIAGVAEPLLGVGPWKECVAGILTASPDLRFTIEDQLVQRERAALETTRHLTIADEASETHEKRRSYAVAARPSVDRRWCERWSRYAPNARWISPSPRDAGRDSPGYQCTARYHRHLLLEPTTDTSANVSFGDVDGDGHLDIVLAKGRHWPAVDRVLIGDGRGGIRMSYDLGAARDRSYSGRLADLNADGFLDVVISNDAPDPKLVYLNDGKGHFRIGSTFGRPEWETRNAAVADLNGDGLQDIVLANRTDSAHAANYICLNRGNGLFDADCLPFARYPATTITAADINHDGLMDLVVPHRDGGQSYVYLAGPNASFADARRVPFGPRDGTIRAAEAADFNGDGVTDIVATDERTGATLYLGRRDGTFAPGIPIGDRKLVPYALTVGDLDGDGKPDIVVGHVEAPSTVYFNDGSGGRFTPVSFGDAKGTVYGFAIGDFDEDGLLDIAAARSEAPNVLYFATRGKRKAS